MQQTFIRLVRQPQVAIATACAALVAMLAALAVEPDSVARPGDVLLAVGLAGTVVLAYQFPVYIRHNTKICVISVPLYLMTVLLPIPLALSAAGIGMACGELMVRKHRGTHFSDIIGNTCRWVLVAFAGATVAHWRIAAGDQVLQELPLLGTAAILWVGDLVTLPLVLTPISGETPSRIISQVVREGGVAEAVQYLVGVLGALISTQQIWAIAMLAVPAVLVYLAFKKDMDEETFQLLESMADSVDLRDPYMGGHSRRVAELAGGVLSELGMHGQEARLIKTAARLHDIGKIGLPDQVLIKSGALTTEEEALVKSYPELGAEMLSGYPDFSRGIEMVLYHHERWDGRGYPAKLTGTEIPFGARLIAVCDSFDAMTNDRPYRRALSVERAAEILRDGRDRQWDPQIVDAFLRSIGQPLEQTAGAQAMRAGPQSGLAMGRTLTA